MRHIPSDIVKLLLLLRIDQLAIIKKIPPEELLIIGGKNDRYLGYEGRRILRQAGRTVVEIDDVGHNWHQRVDRIIAEYINRPS